MELDYETRLAILKLKNTLEIIERIKQRFRILDYPEDVFSDIKWLESHIASLMERIKNMGLFLEEDFH